MILAKDERLFVSRRRKRRAKVDVYKQYGVSEARYSRWERRLEEIPDDMHIPEITDLSLSEELRLHRRRSGMMISEIAAKLGCCRVHLLKMEAGYTSPIALIKFWEKENG